MCAPLLRTGDFDSDDCLDDVETDWEEDSSGKGYLGGGDFYKCWFQLADLNTSSVSAEEYTSFILKLTDAITLPTGGYRDEQAAPPTTNDLNRLRGRASLPAAVSAQHTPTWHPRAPATSLVTLDLACVRVWGPHRALQDLLERIRDAADYEDEEEFAER